MKFSPKMSMYDIANIILKLSCFFFFFFFFFFFLVLKKRDIKVDNVSVINFICNTYSIHIAIWISRTAIYCDTVLVGDTHPYYID